jgi:hypothetical protein
MKLFDFLLPLKEPRPESPELERVSKALVTKAEHQTKTQWDLVNLSRAHRGKPPIEPGHPFRPRDLIDPREGEGCG